MLKWSQAELGRRAGMNSLMPVFYFERNGDAVRWDGTYSGAKFVSDATVVAMKLALKNAGIKFVGNTGIDLKV
jgi:hypothetical protein